MTTWSKKPPSPLRLKFLAEPECRAMALHDYISLLEESIDYLQDTDLGDPDHLSATDLIELAGLVDYIDPLICDLVGTVEYAAHQGYEAASRGDGAGRAKSVQERDQS